MIKFEEAYNFTAINNITPPALLSSKSYIVFLILFCFDLIYLSVFIFKWVCILWLV